MTFHACFCGFPAIFLPDAYFFINKLIIKNYLRFCFLFCNSFLDALCPFDTFLFILDQLKAFFIQTGSISAQLGTIYAEFGPF